MDAAGRPDRSTLAAFAGVVLFGALNTLAVHEIVAELAPSWGAAVRFLAAGLLLVGFVVASGRSMPSGLSLAGAAVYGAIAFAGSYALLYAALREIPAGLTAVFLALVPLETFALAILHRQERFRVLGLLGALIAVFGVAVVVWDRLDAAVPLGGMLLAIAGTAFIAEGAVVLKLVPRADPYGTNGVAMLTGGAILLGLSILGGEPWAAPASGATGLLMAYLVVLGSIGLFGLDLFALRRWTATGVSYSTLFMPLVAVPLSAALAGEAISLPFLAGAGIALIGTYLGAFAGTRAKAATATSAPECMPIADCPEPEGAAAGTPKPADA
jgi:drug/metabolite transporter (DMT)-like permease